MVDKDSGEGPAEDNPNQTERRRIGGNERGRTGTDIATGKGTKYGRKQQHY